MDAGFPTPWNCLNRAVAAALVAFTVMTPIQGVCQTLRIGEVTGSVIGPDRAVHQGVVTIDLLADRSLRIGLSDQGFQRGSVVFRFGPAFRRELSGILEVSLKRLKEWEGSGRGRVRAESFMVMQGATLVFQVGSNPGVFASPFLALVIDGKRAVPVLYLSKRRVGELMRLIDDAAERAVSRDRT